MLTLAHIQSLSGAKLRSVSESQNARSLYFLEACCSTKFFEPNKRAVQQVPAVRRAAAEPREERGDRPHNIADSCEAGGRFPPPSYALRRPSTHLPSHPISTSGTAHHVPRELPTMYLARCLIYTLYTATSGDMQAQIHIWRYMYDAQLQANCRVLA